jgi:hypothetical protein
MHEIPVFGWRARYVAELITRGENGKRHFDPVCYPPCPKAAPKVQRDTQGSLPKTASDAYLYESSTEL